MYAGVMVVLIIYGSVSIPENKGQSLVRTEDKMVAVEDKMVAVEDKKEIQNNKAFEDETKI